jgi:hypothetical protein
MTHVKRPLWDQQYSWIERRELARSQHQQALLAVNRQCLPHGSGNVSEASLNELVEATTELRAAKAAADRAIQNIFRGARRL